MYKKKRTLESVRPNYNYEGMKENEVPFDKTGGGLTI